MATFHLEPLAHYVDSDGVLEVTSDYLHAVEPRVTRRSRTPQPQPSSDRFLTLAEAGELVRTAPETVRFWIWQGRLTAFKPGRAVLVRESELLALVQTRETTRLRAERIRTRRARDSR